MDRYLEILHNGSKEDKLDLINSKKLSRHHMDFVIETGDKGLIRELLFGQEMNADQYLSILSLNDFELSQDLWELHADEKSLPEKLISEIFQNDKYIYLRKTITGSYPIPQEYILNIVQNQNDTGLIEPIISYQAVC